MNEMIERYIYDITRRLPDAERVEVRLELEASINDMLPDNPNEQDITDVLTKLGAPNILAEQYRQKPRYLISPAIYDSYISSLKMVTLIVALVCSFVGVFSEYLLVSGPASIGALIEKAISSAFDGALQAALWVTLGFAIADRSGAYKKQTWTVKDLPRIPDQDGVRISRSGTITGIALTVLFTGLVTLMIVREEWLFVLVRGTKVINPFMQAALVRCIPYILLIGFLSLCVSGAKLYWGRWNTLLCVINAVYNVIWVSTVIYILYWPDLFSGAFREYAEQMFAANADSLRFIATGGVIKAFSAMLIFAAIIDTGTAVWNTWKGKR